MSSRPGEEPLVELNSVTKVYGSGQAAVHALRGIDLRVHEGEFVAVMGSSGSGKSTCINIIGCLDVPTAGTYRFRDVDVGTLDRDQRALLRRNFIGFIFQTYNLLARTTALENVELPLIYRGVPPKERHRLALQALESVGLSQWATHTPAELSGGQQQRVAIARAIVTEPLLLLADEPTGNLDSANSQEIMKLLTGFHRDQGLTIVMVTHEPDVAAYAQRTVHFHDGGIDSDTLNHDQVTV
ncbi:MAG: ABC transporter ATP-binding protein [Acidiferrobacterales bacterium]|jgi:putative ABC transport system ATP-binding protein|nr:ABC transporter ATP-binding protein [Acidiferrobacterales bacterium]